MSGILDLLNSDLGKQIIGGVSQQTKTPENKTADLLNMALPVLMGAMKRNVQQPQGAEGLMGALMGKHDGSILDNLGSLFGGGVDNEVMNDGAGILGHVLGSRQQNVENALSKQSGIDAGSVTQILKIAAPILLGMLGKQARQQKVQQPNQLGGLLEGLLGGGSKQQAPKQQSLIESILDADGDGNILDDVLDMASGKKRGGLGGLLGGLFGKS